VRVHGGRAKAGRFVPSTAYAASLEASIAEERSEWAQAAELLKRARDEDPDGPELAARLGVALCHLGKVQAAMFAIEDALRSDPDLERGYTARARCRLLTAKTAEDFKAARVDLEHALAIDADALDPALLLIELDLRNKDLARARTRAEETVVLHPHSARALRMLAEVAARQGDSKRAMSAALAAATLDDATGAIAKSAALEAIDRSGVVAYALAMRGSSSKSDGGTPICVEQLKAFEAIAARAEPDAIVTAAEGTRSACPELDAEITRIEVISTWTPKTADAVEARALSATSAEARRFGARMRLRRMSIDELLDPLNLPRAEDRPTLAIHLAAAAVRKADKGEAEALARVARDLAPAEPTVARLAGEVMRRLGKPKEDPIRAAACTLARTALEKQSC
jgi:Tfp pilus assembly protein PilF